MIEIKPVYQLKYATGCIDITEDQYFRESYMRGTPRRILYPAAAYEALQKELNQVKEESQKSILNLRTAMDLQIKRDDQTLREANAVHIGQWRQLWDEKEQLENTLVIQAKRIEELEANATAPEKDS